MDKTRPKSDKLPVGSATWDVPGWHRTAKDRHDRAERSSRLSVNTSFPAVSALISASLEIQEHSQQQQRPPGGSPTVEWLLRAWKHVCGQGFCPYRGWSLLEGPGGENSRPFPISAR